jgi:GNAT superfamily N-acetyltransferase
MELQVGRTGAVPDAVERILRDLPAWFGIESSLLEYVADARTLPTYAAFDGDRPVGICLVRHHGAATAEIHLTAVRRAYHRRGIGRQLVRAIEDDLRAGGVRFLQVKTLGRGEASEEYARTRRFYAGLGFVDLEEFAAGDLWPHHACLVMIKHLGEPEQPATACAADRAPGPVDVDGGISSPRAPRW